MIWLVEITISSTLHRISTRYVNDTHQWKQRIIDIVPISYSMRGETGGYIEPGLGSFVLENSLFANDFPPPDTCAVKSMLTDTTEAAAVTVFEGTAHKDFFDRDGSRYNLYGEEFDATINSYAFNNHLDDIFSAMCGGAYLNLVFSNHSTRAQTIDVDRDSVASDEDVIDILSDCAAAFCHCFKIVDGTLHLYDLLENNGTSTLTEFDFKPARYPGHIPYKLIQSGSYSVPGTPGYGSVFKSDVDDFTKGQSTVTKESHLTNQKTILEMERPELTLPLYAANVPAVVEKISWTDATTPPDGATLSSWMRVTGVSFKDANSMSVKGIGGYAS